MATKWEMMRRHLENDTHQLGRAIDRQSLANEWPLVRDLALQMVGLAGVLGNMDRIEQHKEELNTQAELDKIRRRAKRERKRARKAEPVVFDESPV